MLEKLVTYFQQFTPLSPAEAAAIVDSATVLHFKKGEAVLVQGQVARASYFVLQGCVRQFATVDGEERSLDFLTEGQWVISLASLLQQLPARHGFDCLEDCVLVMGNEEKEAALFRDFPQFAATARKVMERVFSDLQEAYAAYATDSPETRYRKLLASRPELVQRVPQYQLASYVGVKPESLSRIRKRIQARDVDRRRNDG
jgi:CRP-like cAMP-binding protein